MKKSGILLITTLLYLGSCVEEERGTPGTGTYEIGTGQEPHHQIDTLKYDTLEQTPPHSSSEDLIPPSANAPETERYE